MVTKDNTSPVLAAAALTLAKDPDPKSGEALANTASGNKSWIVRAAALNAIALRGETSLLPGRRIWFCRTIKKRSAIRLLRLSFV